VDQPAGRGKPEAYDQKHRQKQGADRVHRGIYGHRARQQQGQAPGGGKGSQNGQFSRIDSRQEAHRT
jgi:hypothetical protein